MTADEVFGTHRVCWTSTTGCCAGQALLTDPAVGARLRARWDWVLVDEYQDVNRVQVDIVTALRPDGVGLTVVGDDAKAIYGFREASGDHLHELHTGLPESTLVRLQRNFRSTQPVLDLANVIRSRTRPDLDHPPTRTIVLSRRRPDAVTGAGQHWSHPPIMRTLDV